MPLPCKYKVVMRVSWLIDEGIVPVRPSGIAWMARYCKLAKLPKESGIVPIRLLAESKSAVRLVRLPIDGGIVPAKLLK